MIALGTRGTAESPISLQAEGMIDSIELASDHFVVNVMATRSHINSLVPGNERSYFNRRLAEKLASFGLDGHMIVQSPDDIALRQLKSFVEQ